MAQPREDWIEASFIKSLVEIWVHSERIQASTKRPTTTFLLRRSTVLHHCITNGLSSNKNCDRIHVSKFDYRQQSLMSNTTRNS